MTLPSIARERAAYVQTTINSSIAERDAAVAAAKRAESEARRRHDAFVEEVRAVEAAEAERLDAVLAEHVRHELFPLAKAYGNNPRTVAEQFAAAWRLLNDRCVEQTGATLSSRWIGFAFAETASLTNHVGAPDFWAFAYGNEHATACEDAARAFVGGVSAAEADDFIRKAEAATIKKAREQIPYPHRVVALMSRATSNGMTRAVDALNAAKQRQARPTYDPVADAIRERGEAANAAATEEAKQLAAKRAELRKQNDAELATLNAFIASQEAKASGRKVVTK